VRESGGAELTSLMDTFNRRRITMMRICNDCGAQQVVLGRWQGGDGVCDHCFYNNVPSSKLEAEIKLLLSTYPAEEVFREAKTLCKMEV